MNLLMIAFTVILFVLLTPGVVLSLPPKGTLVTMAVVHGLVFALIYHFSHKAVSALSTQMDDYQMDGFDDMEEDKASGGQMGAAPQGSMCKFSDQCMSGACNGGICA